MVQRRGRRALADMGCMHWEQHGFGRAIGVLDAAAALQTLSCGARLLEELVALSRFAAGKRTSFQGPLWCGVSCHSSYSCPVSSFVAVYLARSLPRPSCTASPGPEPLAMALLLVGLSLLVSVLISTVFFTAILRFFGERLGHYLRRSSRTRRELLLARVATESKNHRAEPAEVDDHDWEELASVATDGNAGSKQDTQWEGIVGFFHPFWYCSHSFAHGMLLTSTAATLAAAENESSGQPSVRRRSAGPRPSALFTLATTT